jgi:glucosamine-6-phosphate deaminase
VGDIPVGQQRFEVDRLKVEIHLTRVEMGVAAGRAVAGLMRKLLRERNGVRMIFAAAPSQNEFLAELGSSPGIDWSRVTALHMDEYVGLSADAPQSFVRYLREHLFDQVQPGTVHLLNGVAPDPTEECERYASLVNEAPIDILCAGIGENGHLAFNDPPADFDDPQTVKVVDLALSCRQQQVHDGCFSDLESVPLKAYTLTVPALMSAHYAFCVVPGPTKAEAVRDTLLLPVSPACPATILRTHEQAILYVDAEAAGLFLPHQG